ncbi:MAG: 2,3-bisphosphoglycerate-independent phosphoglycerate mutase [Gammaproteobacteria bacterium]|nr:2,3-bisphosphoglycerate-independent phosphoglycerate mutase [Gammaproteobacteria bacterium]
MNDTMTRLVPRRPVLLIILDGFGVNISAKHNAVALADTPNFDRWFATNPHTLINTSGAAVGLPDGQMGNSEVGHMTMGSGIIVEQDLVQLNSKIDSGEFFNNAALIKAMTRAREKNRPIHLAGLVSDGGVHSHVQHLLALIKMCEQQKVKPQLHMITDGRDTSPRNALNYLPDVEAALQSAGGSIATVFGRYYAMDRDKRWQRTEKAWRALVLGEGRFADSASAAIEDAYARGENDEFIKPVRLPAAENVQPADDFIFFNFRKDRPRQLLAALDWKHFDAFERCTENGDDAARANVTCMMLYDHSLGMAYAFEHDVPKRTLVEVLAKAGLKHFHCAETEKFAHVTYFFNGGCDQQLPSETRKLLPSPKVSTYDQQPEMSAAAVADAVIDAVDKDEHDFIVVNFANGDMVGHTAIEDAVIKAVETLDTEAGRLMQHASKAGYSIILTADHGNCEEMVDPVTGEPHTQHTTYPVPCLIHDKQAWKLSCDGGLVNIAATVLQLMGLKVPKKMASSLLLEAVPQTKSAQERRSCEEAIKGVA